MLNKIKRSHPPTLISLSQALSIVPPLLLVANMTSNNRRIVGISFPKLTLEELDKVRGDIPRSKYIARLLEKNFSLMEKQT
ncbi:MAG: hypothetical protein ACRD93_09160 [Nitrososphaeraceae archaeon]